MPLPTGSPVSFPLVTSLGVVFGGVTVTWGLPGSSGVEVTTAGSLAPDAVGAVHDALGAAWQHGGGGGALRQPAAHVVLHLPVGVAKVSGRSLGLAVALAARAAHPVQPWEHAWLPGQLVATGSVEDSGEVRPVKELVRKAQGLGSTTRLALFSAPGRGDAHPGMHDQRVVEVRSLEQACRVAVSRQPLHLLRDRLWADLDRRLPRAVPEGESWLSLPPELDHWVPDLLGPHDPRLTLVRGPKGSGRSDIQRRLADRVRGEIEYETIADDLMVWADERGTGLTASRQVPGTRASPTGAAPDDAAHLSHAPLAAAERIWLFADATQWPEMESQPGSPGALRAAITLEMVSAWLALDARIHVVLVVGEFLDDERLAEAGLEAHTLHLEPVWRYPESWTSAGWRGLGHVSPLTAARAMVLPRVRAAVQGVARHAEVRGLEADGSARIWLHHVLAEQLADWAGGNALVGSMLRALGRMVLAPDPPPSGDKSEPSLPIHWWNQSLWTRLSLAFLPDAPELAADPAPVHPAVVEDCLEHWLHIDEASDTLVFRPPAHQRPALVAHALHLHTSYSRWPIPDPLDPDIWLWARDPELRPVLADVLAEAMVDAEAIARTEPEVAEAVFADLSVLVASVLDGAQPNDLRLRAGVVLRAAWVAADTTPEVVPLITDVLVDALAPWGRVDAQPMLQGALADVLCAPSACPFLLACHGASIALIAGVEDAVARHWGPRAVASFQQTSAPLRCLLEGDPTAAAARLTSHRPAPSDRVESGDDVLARFDALPAWGSMDGYLDLLWTECVLLPPDLDPAVVGAVCALADVHWAAVEAWLDADRLASLDAEAVDEFLNDQWLALLATAHLPWGRSPHRRALRAKLGARAAQLGISLDGLFDRGQSGADIKMLLEQLCWDMATGARETPSTEAEE